MDAEAQGDNDLDMSDQEELAQQWKGPVFPCSAMCYSLAVITVVTVKCELHLVLM